jgi:bifunctional non-homologous end joining protein LigD
MPKTSGQTGLHELVPLGGVPFDAAKILAELLGRILHARRPDISTIERMRARRPQAVYIDTGQTGRSRAIVAPYSVRAYRGARVSTPLSWDEVSFSLDPSIFTMFTVPERVQQHGDPMAGLLEQKPDVARAVQELGKLL